MYFTDFLIKGASPSHNKAYALHSLAVVRATPNRGEKTAATSHKQNVGAPSKLEMENGFPAPMENKIPRVMEINFPKLL